MTSEDRREREKSQMKELIIRTAEKIIVDEGYEKLSIRKIANQIEYSPAIIYHYFQNKEEVIGCVMREGYERLIAALAENSKSPASAKERLQLLTKKYITTALQDPDQFMTIQFNKSPGILGFTSYLFEGASEKKAALQVLAQAVRDLRKEQNQIQGEDIELTAQMIAASTLGMVAKLILEKDIGENRRNQLIDAFTETVVRMASSPSEAALI